MTCPRCNSPMSPSGGLCSRCGMNPADRYVPILRDMPFPVARIDTLTGRTVHAEECGPWGDECVCGLWESEMESQWLDMGAA